MFIGHRKIAVAFVFAGAMAISAVTPSDAQSRRYIDREGSGAFAYYPGPGVVDPSAQQGQTAIPGQLAPAFAGPQRGNCWVRSNTNPDEDVGGDSNDIGHWGSCRERPN